MPPAVFALSNIVPGSTGILGSVGNANPPSFTLTFATSLVFSFVATFLWDLSAGKISFCAFVAAGCIFFSSAGLSFTGVAGVAAYIVPVAINMSTVIMVFMFICLL